MQDLFGAGRLGAGYNVLAGPVEVQVDARCVEKAKELLAQIEKGEFEILEDFPEEKELKNYE